MSEETSRGAGFRVALTAGLLLLAGAALFVFVIPTADDRHVVLGCFEGQAAPPKRLKITLWEQWKWDRAIRAMILQQEAAKGVQKPDQEKAGNVGQDP